MLPLVSVLVLTLGAAGRQAPPAVPAPAAACSGHGAGPCHGARARTEGGRRLHVAADDGPRRGHRVPTEDRRLLLRRRAPAVRLAARARRHGDALQRAGRSPARHLSRRRRRSARHALGVDGRARADAGIHRSPEGGGRAGGTGPGDRAGAPRRRRAVRRHAPPDRRLRPARGRDDLRDRHDVPGDLAPGAGRIGARTAGAGRLQVAAGHHAVRRWPWALRDGLSGRRGSTSTSPPRRSAP